MHLHAVTKPLNLQVSSIIHFNLNAERRFEGKLSSLVLHTCVLHLASTPVHKALAVYVALGRFRLRWLFSGSFSLWQWPMRLWSGCDGRLSGDKQKVSVVDEGARPTGPLM